jgi:hypothetical protein
MTTKIKLVRRKDGTAWYADEAGKFFDPFIAKKDSFVIVGEVQESDARAAVVVESKSTTLVTPTLRELKDAQVKSYQKMGLSLAEAKIAAGIEDRVLKEEDAFAAYLQGL